jgi:drug/metabolite transporter (DMT)-like permease
MIMQKPDIRIELALLLALATLWGASYTFIKLGVETIPPVTLIAARTLIAGSILLGIIKWRGLVLPKGLATWRGFLVQACLNSVVPFTLIAWAERTVDAGLAAILNSTTPIFAFLLTVLITRHEPVGARRLFGVVAGITGTCLIIGIEAFHGLGDELPAQLAIVAATVCYAGAAIFGRGFKGLDPIMPAAGSLVCGAVILIPVSLAVDRPWGLVPSQASILALIGLSVFSTALAFVIYFRLVHTLGSVGTTAQAYLRVPIGVGIGVLFLRETMTSTAWGGLACVIAGVAAMTIPARKPTRGLLPLYATSILVPQCVRSWRVARRIMVFTWQRTSWSQAPAALAIKVGKESIRISRAVHRVLQYGSLHGGDIIGGQIKAAGSEDVDEMTGPPCPDDRHDIRALSKDPGDR